MAFLLPKHSSAATARLTEDTHVAPQHLSPSKKCGSSDGTTKAGSLRHPIESELQHWLAEEERTLPPVDVLPSKALTKSTSFSSSTDDSDDEDDSDDDDDDYSDNDDNLSDCSSTGNPAWSPPPGDQQADNDAQSITSLTSATSNSSLTDMIGEYNDGDLQTLNQLVNKLHAADMARQKKNRTPKIKNHRKTSSASSTMMTRHAEMRNNNGSPHSPVDLPSELPEHPPHFSPLQSSHHLSISSVNSWRGPSLEIVPTEDVADILPLWESQWTSERLEWEHERRRRLLQLQPRDAFQRSRTSPEGGEELIVGPHKRNRSLPNSLPRSDSLDGALGGGGSGNRNYRYGKPPTLPHAKHPNPMVIKSSKKIHKKHARYALTAGMMLGIRESVGGAMGVENELEIRGWERWEAEEDAMLERRRREGSQMMAQGAEDEDEVDVEGNASEPPPLSQSQSQKSHPPSSSPASPMGYTEHTTLLTECARITKYKFPPHQFYLGSNTAKPLPHKYKFKVYAPLVFGRIRSLFGLEKQTFLHSICGKFNFYEFASNARSGQFFFYSHDGRYMIKTLTYTESKFLREILPYYYRHLTRYPSTFLTHFYGMYRVCMPNANNQRLHFIIMRSVFHTEKKIDRVWDLKGSKAGRRAGKGDSVGKDLDILEEGRKLRFREPGARSKFLEQLARDATFLARLGIMDYSLLLGLHDCKEGDGCSNDDDPEVPTTPRDGAGKKEPSRSNTPFRRNVLERASSVGATKVENDGFKALEAMQVKKKKKKKGGRRNSSAAEAGGSSTSASSELNAIAESAPDTPSTSSSSTSTSRRTALSSSPIPKNSITSRSDSGIEGYGMQIEDGTLAKREIYFCGIIDILQYYNARKMGETVIRKAAGNSGQDISCVDPETYGKRFVKFISKLVEE
eukprot:CAMPEP_0183707060 /NCGR_PEP_ID=MMETSP0737-20130205/3735_1 /TAXON_ID=385413 /ORGANISM="Thalassiosira miniscula, Strain CCMP1093" /LENGTH=907 /DNA_ID=CAMNT_0025934635 /DNA_START=147 /DNA_END=2870 /DNA_ORIENTATION=-